MSDGALIALGLVGASIMLSTMPKRPTIYRPQRSTARPLHPRPSPTARGYTSAWARASRAFLDEHPLCSECSTPERPVASEVTDHVIPHKGDAGLFWDRDNWRALCKRCHDRATCLYDGGFGRVVREKPKGASPAPSQSSSRGSKARSTNSGRKSAAWRATCTRPSADSRK